jgi:hypothetical protein
VVFRKVESTSRNEDESKEKGPEKMEFELKNEEYDSIEEESFELEDEMEPQTLALRRYDHVGRLAKRYCPLGFRSDFVLFVINNEPRSVHKAINSKERKLWKNAMVEEMEPFDKNEV